MTIRLSRFIVIILALISLTAIDFFTKHWAEHTRKGKPAITLISHTVDIGFAENRGMVFGIGNGAMPRTAQKALVALRICILIGLTIFLAFHSTKPLRVLVPLLLFWAGALGNLIDPFLYGYVVDFIHIRLGDSIRWPFYFNMADAYITVGIALFLIDGAFFKRTFARSTVPSV